MKPIARSTWNNLSRLMLVAALMLPTFQIALAQHEWAFPVKLIVWGLALTLLPAALPSLPYLFFLGLMWLLSPLMLAYVGYIAFNGLAPQPLGVAAMLHEASDENIIFSIRTVLASNAVCGWFAAYLVILAFATFSAWIGRKSAYRIYRPLLAFCLIALSSVLWFQIVTFTSVFPPSWMMNEHDFQQTFLGETTCIAYNFLDPDFHERALGTGGMTHKLAHENQTVSKPLLSVLVIGESMRASGLGPDKASRDPWTARLDERTKAGLGVWLPPACASHDSTAISVPMLITGTAPAEEDSAAEAPTGLSRMQAAGYRVGWITSSGQLGFAGPEVMEGRGFFYSQGFHANPLDEDLLPVAADFVSPLMKAGYEGKPMALVLHLVGSHYTYKDRYPQSLFDPEPKGLSEEDLDYLRYERANEYTAKNLAAIGDMLDKVKVPAFAIYTSDHGENLMRDHNGLLRHIGARTSMTAIKVPVLVLWNDAARKTGQPQRILSKLQKAPVIAQVDIYRSWMSLSGMDGSKTVEPTPDPQVFGALNLGDKLSPLPCSRLLP